MTYTYYFRRRPDLTQPMPEGCNCLRIHREPEYEPRLQCDVYGYATFGRRLYQQEKIARGLVDDPHNYLAGVMRGGAI